MPKPRLFEDLTAGDVFMNTGSDTFYYMRLNNKPEGQRFNAVCLNNGNKCWFLNLTEIKARPDAVLVVE